MPVPLAERAQSAWLSAMPGVFVVLWSTGFIGARLGLPYAEPLTFLALRFVLVAALLGLISLWMRAPWPRRPAEIAHLAVAGLLVHAVYLGGVFASIHHGVQTGVSALIVGIQPLLVAAVAGPLLGERVTPWQWAGLCLGLAGVALVVSAKLAEGLGTPLGMALSFLALIGITAGTVYQKRWCAGMDMRTGNAVQFAAAAAAMGILAPFLESMQVAWSGAFLVALAWLVLVLSLGAITLLYLLIRRGAASRVAALFYMVPPCTALIAYGLFGERLGPQALLGMALAVAGVALVNLKP